jgi:hypothetical protein
LNVVPFRVAEMSAADVALQRQIPAPPRMCTLVGLAPKFPKAEALLPHESSMARNVPPMSVPLVKGHSLRLATGFRKGFGQALGHPVSGLSFGSHQQRD